jgi:hypothetical protein
VPVNNPNAQPVPEFLADDKEHRREIARRLNLITQGKLNITLDVTLAANVASTTITDPRIGFYSAVVPAMAGTKDAAAELATGNLYVDTLTKGSCVVHHSNNAQTDRTIRFLIIG